MPDDGIDALPQPFERPVFHAPSPVEMCHRRMLVFSIVATLALGIELGYNRLVPQIPPLYAALLRAAVWDCVIVGVLVAQAVDLSSLPLLTGIDSGHYLPLAVLLYHALTMLFCLGFDGLSRSRGGRSRSLHRILVSRRVLLELAGGTSGSKLYLGRVCFFVSGAVIWLSLRVLLWVDDGMNSLTCFIILLLVAYCAAGLAASEVRHTMPGHLVQWLFTGWGAREAILQGPLKLIGGFFLLPFAVSVIAAQIWLRTLAFLVWLTVGCPCCRLQRADNVYDAFERELAIPLLQCSFLAYAGALSAAVLCAGQLSSMQRTAVGVSSLYYTGMLLMWAAPAVLQSKVAFEESFDSSSALAEDGQVRLLGGENNRSAADSDVELEDVRSACEELRALLLRERHDHSVELAQLQSRLKDQELRTRSAERERDRLMEKQGASRPSPPREPRPDRQDPGALSDGLQKPAAQGKKPGSVGFGWPRLPLATSTPSSSPGAKLVQESPPAASPSSGEEGTATTRTTQDIEHNTPVQQGRQEAYSEASEGGESPRREETRPPGPPCALARRSEGEGESVELGAPTDAPDAQAPATSAAAAAAAADSSGEAADVGQGCAQDVDASHAEGASRKHEEEEEGEDEENATLLLEPQ